MAEVATTVDLVVACSVGFAAVSIFGAADVNVGVVVTGGHEWGPLSAPVSSAVLRIDWILHQFVVRPLGTLQYLSALCRGEFAHTVNSQAW